MSVSSYDSYKTMPLEFQHFLSNCMKSFKCSAHDENHCYRVANIAITIASNELKADKRIVYLGALAHDVLDAKLVEGNHVNDIEKELQLQLLKFVSIEEYSLIIDIVKSVGYKNLLKDNWNPNSKSLEYRCVQDADLLDAIGSIGIARCYSYGGSKNRDLFNLEDVSFINSHEDYMNQRTGGANLSNLQHFFDKLLRIKSMMTTSTGRLMAEKRHNAMVSFLENLSNELIDSGSNDGNILVNLIEKYK